VHEPSPRLRPEALRQTDGRRRRGERTRRSIVEAHTALLREGDLKPTAQTIAERAGVSVRTLWVAFGDMEGLLDATTDYWLRSDWELRDPVDGDLPLDERLDRFCAERARRLENIAPAARSAALSEPFSAALQASRRHHVQRVRDAVEEVFATEIAALDASRREDQVLALTAASSWNTWSLLRDDLGLDVPAASAVVRRSLEALLAG
jgi:AcrR family transcriptional regulator